MVEERAGLHATPQHQFEEPVTYCIQLIQSRSGQWPPVTRVLGTSLYFDDSFIRVYLQDQLVANIGPATGWWVGDNNFKLSHYPHRDACAVKSLQRRGLSGGRTLNVLHTHQVPSESNSGREYTVTVYDTHAHCTCPAWARSKQPNDQRVCKHIEHVTGELRRGDAKLTDAEAVWVIRNLLGATDMSFSAIADAVEQDLSANSALSDYERELSHSIIATFRGAKHWQENEAPGPDAQQALWTIHRALKP